MRGIENKLGLPSLANGFNGTEIRIWFGYALSDSIQILKIGKANSQWTAKLYSINYRMTEQNDSLILFNSDSLSKTPKSGRKTFTDSLNNLAFLHCPIIQKSPDTKFQRMEAARLLKSLTKIGTEFILIPHHLTITKRYGRLIEYCK